jgi:hypothetical protein
VGIVVAASAVSSGRVVVSSVAVVVVAATVLKKLRRVVDSERTLSEVFECKAVDDGDDSVKGEKLHPCTFEARTATNSSTILDVRLSIIIFFSCGVKLSFDERMRKVVMLCVYYWMMSDVDESVQSRSNSHE